MWASLTHETTAEQDASLREEGLALCELLGLDPASVRAGSFEVMSTQEDGQIMVRFHWVGMAKAPLADVLAAVPRIQRLVV